MKIYYYHDRFTHAAQNAGCKDYTPAYLPVILKNIGFSAQMLEPYQLDELSPGDMLFIGAETLDEPTAAALKAAVDRGCGLIAFGTQADGLLPKTEPVVCVDDIYSVVGYFKYDDVGEPLPVLEQFRALPQDLDTVLGSISTKDGKTYSAFAKLSDRVWYWSFDLPATLWRAADGHPTFDAQEGLPYARVPDSDVLDQSYDYSIAYADSYQRCIENILSDLGFVRVWALPAQNDSVCDLALYFAGDDDAASAENDLNAAKEMHKRGLPYHLNLMPCDRQGHFVITKEQYDELQELGCETDLHYDFTAFPYSEEGHRLQRDMFVKAFGEIPVGPVNHCLVQIGTAAERYRMQVECGAKSDNNRFQYKSDPDDINAFNLLGFAYGSAFPRFVLCDATHSNRELQFCDIYNSYYEPRIYEGKPEEIKKIHDYLDAGYTYGRTLQLFTHPHYISGWNGIDSAPALRAIDCALDYVKSKNWNVWYCAPNALADWWHGRATCSVSDTTESGFKFENPTSYRVSVVLPQGVNAVKVNSKEVPVVKKTVAGKTISFVTLDSGESTVAYI